MVFARGDLKWTTNEAIWFPAVGETLKMAGIHVQSSKLYRMAITRGRGLASAVIRFNLHDAEGNTLSRLETSGGHLNPIGPPFPDPLLEEFSGRRFIDEAHLHLVFDEYGDSWAIPLSITDFFTCDPVKVMMSAYIVCIVGSMKHLWFQWSYLMIMNCDFISKNVLNQISNLFPITSNAEYCIVHTPFFDRHRDLLQFYIRQESGGFVVSDEGYSISEFEALHGELEVQHISKLISHTMAKINDGCLTIRTEATNLSQAILEVAHASIAVLGVLPKQAPETSARISTKVRASLQARHVPFIPNARVRGRNIEHHFDFEVSLKVPLFLRTITQPNDRNTFEAFIYAATDTNVEGKSYVAAMITEKELKDTYKKELERLTIQCLSPSQLDDIVVNGTSSIRPAKNKEMQRELI